MPDSINSIDHELCTIDGVELPVVQMESISALSDFVRQSRSRGRAVYPCAGRTQLDYGLPPSRPGSAIDLRALDEVIDYPARDMTITVYAGMPIGRLQTILAAENQRLPIDVPRSDRATVGGSLACNISGPRRLVNGTFRDFIIGIAFINDEGIEVKAGGRVVKNVAGYDFCKLMTGSLGTLGIITQVTFKVVPAPEQHALVLLYCKDRQVAQLINQLHKSRTSPACIEVLNRRAIAALRTWTGNEPAEADFLIIVGFENNEAAVNWQVKQLIKEVERACPLDIRIGPTSNKIWTGLVELTGGPDYGLSIKCAMMPSAAADFCCRLSSQDEELAIQAHAGNGIVRVYAASATSIEKGTRTLEMCRNLIQQYNGSAIVHHCPSAWKQSISVWGQPPPAMALMRRIKQQLDPHNIFNPGRFVGGI